MRGNARLSGHRFVHPGSALMTPEPVIFSLELKMRKMDKVEGRLPLTRAVTLHGAQTLSTSAESESTRIAVTIQTASNGMEEKRRVPGSTTLLVTPNYERRMQQTDSF